MKPGSIDPGFLIFGRSTHVYHTCFRCGALISSEPAHYLDCDDDEEYPYCHDCYDELRSCVIREYHYKPARTVMPWREVMDKAIDLDYRSTRPTPAGYMSSQPHLVRAG